MLCCVVSWYAVLCCVVLRYIMLSCRVCHVLCSVLLCDVMWCDIMSCFVALSLMDSILLVFSGTADAPHEIPRDRKNEHRTEHQVVTINCPIWQKMRYPRSCSRNIFVLRKQKLKWNHFLSIGSDVTEIFLFLKLRVFIDCSELTFDKAHTHIHTYTHTHTHNTT